MGKQINFFLTLEDWQKVKTYLIEKEFVFLDGRKQDFIKTLSLSEIQNTDFQVFYLILAKQFDLFLPKFEALPPHKRFDTDIFPIIEVDSGFWNAESKYAFRGRFFYEPIYLENNEWFEKEEEFVKAARNFFAWFKRNFKQMEIAKNFYIGKELAQMLENQEATISF